MRWMWWLLVLCLLLTGCSNGSDKSVTTEVSEGVDILVMADTSGMEFRFDEEDTVASDAAAGTEIPISADTAVTTASGVQTYYITSGGTYTLSGTISDTMVTVDAGKADVNLILNGAVIQNSKEGYIVRFTIFLLRYLQPHLAPCTKYGVMTPILRHAVRICFSSVRGNTSVSVYGAVL